MALATFSDVSNDFAVCKSKDWDHLPISNLPAEFVREDELVAIWHVAFSAVSMACCLSVLVVSLRVPVLRKFPANMLLWKTACDSILSLIVVIINASLLAAGIDRQMEHGAAMCRNGWVAGLTGFLLLASPGWFFALAYNLNRSLHDPFTRPQSRISKFHAGVWSTSGFVGIIVALLHEYRPNEHMCWSCHGLDRVFNWLLLFGWILLYTFDAAFWFIHSRRVNERLSSRAAQLRSSLIYVAILGIQVRPNPSPDCISSACRS